MKKLITTLIVFLFALPPWVVVSQTNYQLTCDEQLLKASLDTALSQVGTTELTGHNDGPQIKKYQEAAGIGYKLPYCAAGQYYSFLQAVKALKKPLSDIPIVKTGLANGMFNAAMRIGIRSGYSASKHALIVYRTPGKSTGHIERIVKVHERGWVTTVAFNTSDSDPRNGDGVRLKLRNIYHPLGRMVVRGLISFRAQ